MKYLFLAAVVCFLIGCTKQEGLTFELEKEGVMVHSGEVHKPWNIDTYFFYLDDEPHYCWKGKLAIFRTKYTYNHYDCKIYSTLLGHKEEIHEN